MIRVQLNITETVSDLQGVHNILISAQTVRRRLHEANLHARRPLRVPPISRGNHATRLDWT